MRQLLPLCWRLSSVLLGTVLPQHFSWFSSCRIFFFPSSIWAVTSSRVFSLGFVMGERSFLLMGKRKGQPFFGCPCGKLIWFYSARLVLKRDSRKLIWTSNRIFRLPQLQCRTQRQSQRENTGRYCSNPKSLCPLQLLHL